MRVWLWAILAVFLTAVGRPVAPFALPHAPVVSASAASYRGVKQTVGPATLSRSRSVAEDEPLLARRDVSPTITASHHRAGTDGQKNMDLYVLFPPSRGQPEPPQIALDHAEPISRRTLLRRVSLVAVPRAPPVS